MKQSAAPKWLVSAASFGRAVKSTAVAMRELIARGASAHELAAIRMRVIRNMVNRHGRSKYEPHQGARECLRRQYQANPYKFGGVRPY